MWVTRDGFDAVIVSPEGRFLLAAGTAGLVELQPHQVVEVCDVCEEEPTTDDPLGHFKLPNRPDVYVLVHGQCGLDQELELA